MILIDLLTIVSVSICVPGLLSGSIWAGDMALQATRIDRFQTAET